MFVPAAVKAVPQVSLAALLLLPQSLELLPLPGVEAGLAAASSTVVLLILQFLIKWELRLAGEARTFTR